MNLENGEADPEVGTLTKLSYANLNQTKLSQAGLSRAKMSQAKLSWVKLLGKVEPDKVVPGKAQLSQPKWIWATLSQATVGPCYV